MVDGGLPRRQRPARIPGERRLIVVMAEDLTTGMADVIRQAAKDIIAALSSKGVKK